LSPRSPPPHPHSPPPPHSSPTRRSSDLATSASPLRPFGAFPVGGGPFESTIGKLIAWGRASAPTRRGAAPRCGAAHPRTRSARRDRKSTHLNSSHDQISYAVFCLDKKTN